MARRTLLFAVVALAQLAIPAWMIVGHERIRSTGKVFKFRTAPIDPRDPFRGEYVALNFEAENGKWPLHGNDSTVAPSMHAYATLGTDQEGFAQIVTLQAARPQAGDFIPVEYMSWTPDTLFGVRLPFDRYYLEEGDGKKTENLLSPQWNEGVTTQPLPAYVVVRILNGGSVIEDLIVGDRSIHDWLADPAVVPVP